LRRRRSSARRANVISGLIVVVGQFMDGCKGLARPIGGGGFALLLRRGHSLGVSPRSRNLVRPAPPSSSRSPPTRLAVIVHSWWWRPRSSVLLHDDECVRRESLLTVCSATGDGRRRRRRRRACGELADSDRLSVRLSIWLALGPAQIPAGTRLPAACGTSCVPMSGGAIGPDSHAHPSTRFGKRTN
jgi:hypothetical protein